MQCKQALPAVISPDAPHTLSSLVRTGVSRREAREDNTTHLRPRFNVSPVSHTGGKFFHFLMEE